MVKLFAKADVDRREAGADGRRDRTLQRDLVGQDGVEHLPRPRIAKAGQGLRADKELLPFPRHAGALDDRYDRGRDLGADAVAGQEGDLVSSHWHTSFERGRGLRRPRTAWATARPGRRTPGARAGIAARSR